MQPSDNGLDYQFAADSIVFQCNYARSIDVDEFEINFDSVDSSDPIQKQGSLTYNLQVNAGGPGEMSTLIFTPFFNITGVVATYVYSLLRSSYGP